MKNALPILLCFLMACASTQAYADIKTHCQGRGELIYLIGGGPAFTTWNLQPIQNALSQQYRVCRWDMRGVGDNADLAIAQQPSALSQWLDDMHKEIPREADILWGHSWGALQVLLFAKNNPDRVKNIILSNPVDPALRSLEQIEQKRFNHPDMVGHLRLEDIDTSRERLYSLRSKIASYFENAEQGWSYALLFTEKDTNNALNVRIWDEYRKAPLRHDDMEQLASKISGLIYCQNDVLQPENLMEYRRLFSKSEHHVLTGCAHFPWEENPEEYFRVLKEFIER